MKYYPQPFPSGTVQFVLFNYNDRISNKYKPMRVLVIEDDEDIQTMLKMNLEASAFSVDIAKDGEEGSYMARTSDYDLVITDYMMPKKNGKQVCDEIRKAGKMMPIIMLTVRSSTEAKVEVLNAGADDYLTKPFVFKELLARIRALLRRPQALESTTYTVGDLTVDTLGQKVTCNGKDIYLTRKEYALLEYLIKHRGVVVSRSMILEHVWDAEGDPFSNTIEAHILNLRKKLDTAKTKYIQTVPGRGYTIDETRELP